MLKKMRSRFILAAMAAISAVIVVLLCALNLWNYRTVARQQDDTLQMLLSVEQREKSPPGIRSGPPFDTMGKFSPEVPYMLRYFSVSYDASGALVRVNQDFIASITAEDAERYAAHVLAAGRSQGYYRGYRYLVKSDGGTQVLFLNSERELASVRSLLWLTLAIAGGSLAVVLLLVAVFSRRAIAPYLRNLEAQKQFITNASHELKTPLTAISASADVLAMEHGEDEWVRGIQTQATRLARLVAGLVTLSRLDEENPFPARAAFSVSDALWELSEPFDRLARAGGKRFSQQIADDLTLTGDREAILQMVSILLDNAVKYASPGGAIALTARRCGKRIEIAVENDCALPDDFDIERLFDRFYRADASRGDAAQGTGIGLSIARATAQAHGGTLTAALRAGTIVFRAKL